MNVGIVFCYTFVSSLKVKQGTPVCGAVKLLFTPFVYSCDYICQTLLLVLLKSTLGPCIILFLFNRLDKIVHRE